jgi:cobaltochelatase CobS
MTIALTNAARAAIKKALRGKVSGLDTMTKAELLAAAASNGIDVAEIIASTPDAPAPTPTDIIPELDTDNSEAAMETENAPTPAPLPRALQPAPADKAAKLAALLAELAGGNQAPLDEGRVIELIAEHAPRGETRDRFIVKEVEAEPAPARELPDMPRHAVFGDVLAAVSAGLNVMLVGPAGAGKTHLCQQVADALALQFSFTGALDSPYKLLGFIDAQGRTVRTAYRESYEHGRLFAWDEIDASAPAAMLAFNAGLANGHQDFPDACVPRHPNARFIASANTYGRGQDRVYVGRNQLDAASLDRFVMIEMDYDEKLERALFGDNVWVQRVHKVRAAVRALNVRHVVSMRAIEQGAALLKAGMPQDRAEALALWKGLDKATVEKIKAAA